MNAWWMFSLVLDTASAGWVEPTNEGNMEVLVPDGVRVLETGLLHTRIDNSTVDMRYAKAFVYGAREWFEQAKAMAEWEFYLKGAKVLEGPTCTQGDVDICWGRVSGKEGSEKGVWTVVVGQIPNGGAGVAVLIAGTPEDLAAHAAIIDQVKVGFRAVDRSRPAPGPVAAPAPAAPATALGALGYEDEYYEAPPAIDFFEVPGYVPPSTAPATRKVPGPCEKHFRPIGRKGAQRHVFTYDAAGRVLEERITTMDSLIVERSAYDTAGRLTTVAHYADLLGEPLPEQPYMLTTHTYDGAGRRIRTASHSPDDPSYVHSEITYAYDAAGRLTKQTGPEGKVVTFAYDAAGLLVLRTTTPALSGVEWFEAAFTYDTFGNLLLQRDTHRGGGPAYDTARWEHFYGCW